RDAHYWTQSGRVFFDAAQFFLPIRAVDPFTNEYLVTYDSFSLLVTNTQDPLGNIAQAENDYRVLAPRLITDPNLNRTEVAFDALGMVTKTAVMGKATETLGDSLDSPTTLLEYDLLRWQNQGLPAFVKTTARELHVHQELNTPLQVSFAYSDGFGRVVMQKVQAEPGEVPGMSGTIDPRWVGTGRT